MINSNKKLNLKQKTFCRYYATDRECFGNGLQAYAKAYKIDLSVKKKVNIAKANAHRLLTNADILDYIHELLENEGLNEEYVGKELLFLIKQDANLQVKLSAIKTFYLVKELHKDRIPKNRSDEVNLNTVIQQLKFKTTEELQRIA